MNDTEMAAAAGDAKIAAAATALDQGQRLQQRQEWERAFLHAQRRQSPAPASGAANQDAAPAENRAQAAGGVARSGPVAPAQVTAAGPGERAGPAPASAQPAAQTPAIGSTRPAAAPVAQGADAAAIVKPQGSASPRAAAAARPAPPAPPSAPPPRGEAPEPVAVRVHERDGAVQMHVRDASLGATDARGLVARLRGLLHRLGLRLISLTLNGSRIVEERPSPARATAADANRNDLDLTI